MTPSPALRTLGRALGRALDRLVPWLWPLALADLVANVAIVVTGGAVRLTASGLGCPTWPRCTEESYVAHGELGLHGVVEFGNRMMTPVLVVITLLTLLAAWRSGRRRATRLALVVALGVPSQALLGGVTVLSRLNPWVVAIHFLVSMALVAVCVLLLDDLRGPERGAAPLVVRRATLVVFALGWLSLYLGTVVTGSGPHAGDLEARRTGLDPQLMSHVHAASVYLLVAATVVLLALARRTGSRGVLGAAGVLLAVELAQGVVGFVQYATDLPELLVGIHMLGAALISASLTHTVLAGRPLKRWRTHTPVSGSATVTS